MSRRPVVVRSKTAPPPDLVAMHLDVASYHERRGERDRAAVHLQVALDAETPPRGYMVPRRGERRDCGRYERCLDLFVRRSSAVHGSCPRDCAGFVPPPREPVEAYVLRVGTPTPEAA